MTTPFVDDSSKKMNVRANKKRFFFPARFRNHAFFQGKEKVIQAKTFFGNNMDHGSLLLVCLVGGKFEKHSFPLIDETRIWDIVSFLHYQHCPKNYGLKLILSAEESSFPKWNAQMKWTDLGLQPGATLYVTIVLKSLGGVKSQDVSLSWESKSTQSNILWLITSDSFFFKVDIQKEAKNVHDFICPKRDISLGQVILEKNQTFSDLFVVKCPEELPEKNLSGDSILKMRLDVIPHFSTQKPFLTNEDFGIDWIWEFNYPKQSTFGSALLSCCCFMLKKMGNKEFEQLAMYANNFVLDFPPAWKALRYLKLELGISLEMKYTIVQYLGTLFKKILEETQGFDATKYPMEKLFESSNLLFYYLLQIAVTGTRNPLFTDAVVFPQVGDVIRLNENFRGIFNFSGIPPPFNATKKTQYIDWAKRNKYPWFVVQGGNSLRKLVAPCIILHKDSVVCLYKGPKPCAVDKVQIHNMITNLEESHDDQEYVLDVSEHMKPEGLDLLGEPLTPDELIVILFDKSYSMRDKMEFEGKTEKGKEEIDLGRFENTTEEDLIAMFSDEISRKPLLLSHFGASKFKDTLKYSYSSIGDYLEKKWGKEQDDLLFILAYRKILRKCADSIFKDYSAILENQDNNIDKICSQNFISNSKIALDKCCNTKNTDNEITLCLVHKRDQIIKTMNLASHCTLSNLFTEIEKLFDSYVTSLAVIQDSEEGDEYLYRWDKKTISDIAKTPKSILYLSVSTDKGTVGEKQPLHLRLHDKLCRDLKKNTPKWHLFIQKDIPICALSYTLGYSNFFQILGGLNYVGDQSYQCEHIYSDRDMVVGSLPHKVYFDRTSLEFRLDLNVWSSQYDRPTKERNHEMTKLDISKQLFNLWATRCQASQCNYLVGLMAFSSEVPETVAFTNFWELFKDQIQEVKASGDTRLYDSIEKAIEFLKKQKLKHPKSVCRIICFTDGEDDGSKRYYLRSTMKKKLKDEDIILDSINIIPTQAKFSKPEIHFLALETGGYSFHPVNMNDCVELMHLETFMQCNKRARKTQSVGWNSEYHHCSGIQIPPIALPLEVNSKVLSYENLENIGASPISANNPAVAHLLNLFSKYQKNPHSDILCAPVENNVFFWKGAMHGPESSAYAKGIWEFYLEFPQDFPQQPPIFRLITPIVHCNVNTYGKVCHSVLDRDWNPNYDVHFVLSCVYGLLLHPDTSDAINLLLAAKFYQDKAEYCKQIEQSVLDSASKHNWTYYTTLFSDATKNSDTVAQDAKNVMNMTCQICCNLKSDTILQPCAHLCCCSKCVVSLKSCPLCRKAIEGTIKVYF
jgi:ubiquitin-protein ligase